MKSLTTKRISMHLVEQRKENNFFGSFVFSFVSFFFCEYFLFCFILFTFCFLFLNLFFYEQIDATVVFWRFSSILLKFWNTTAGGGASWVLRPEQLPLPYWILGGLSGPKAWGAPFLGAREAWGPLRPAIPDQPPFSSKRRSFLRRHAIRTGKPALTENGWSSRPLVTNDDYPLCTYLLQLTPTDQSQSFVTLVNSWFFLASLEKIYELTTTSLLVFQSRNFCFEIGANGYKQGIKAMLHCFSFHV